MKEDPLITVCSTSYQVAKTVNLSLRSIIAALKELGISYEIVIVDNYSADGTREKLLSLSREVPLRIYEYKCSRGLGRALCIRLARGKHILMVDLDRMYDPNALKYIIMNYLRIQEKYPNVCAVLCPRDILLKINYRDLNRAEDVDLGVRIMMAGINMLTIPINKPLYRELRIIGGNNAVKKSLFRFIGTAPSENRYVKSLPEYLKRELRNKSDMLIGGAYTLTKFIREDYYVWLSRIMGNKEVPFYVKIPMVLLRSLTILPIMIINGLRGIEKYEASKAMSNHVYLYLMKVLTYPLSINILKDMGLINIEFDLKRYINDWLRDAEFTYAWIMYKYASKR